MPAAYLCYQIRPALLTKILHIDSVPCCRPVGYLCPSLTLLVDWCLPTRLLPNLACDPAQLSTGLGEVEVPPHFCLLDSQVQVWGSNFLAPAPYHCLISPNFQGCSDRNCAQGHPHHIQFVIQVCDTFWHFMIRKTFYCFSRFGLWLILPVPLGFQIKCPLEVTLCSRTAKQNPCLHFSTLIGVCSPLL